MDKANKISLLVSAALLVVVLVCWNQHRQLRSLQQVNDQLREEVKQLQSDSISAKSLQRFSGRSSTNQSTPIPPQTESIDQQAINRNEDPSLQRIVQTIAVKLNKLNQKLEQNPELNIPELLLLSDNEWIKVTLDSEVATEDDLREALSKLRDKAVNTFFDEALRPAIQRYLATHNSVMPEDLAELRPYLKVAMDESVFERYELGQKGALSSDPGKALVVLKSQVDEDYHSEHNMTINGSFGGRVNRVEGMVEEATKTFVQKHNGAIPQSPNDIAPYLIRDLPRETVQKYFSKMMRKEAH